MRTNHTARTALGLFALFASTGCTAVTFTNPPGDNNPPSVGGGGGGDAGTEAGNSDAGTGTDAALPPTCDPSKLPTEDGCVINEAAGVFVSASLGGTAGDGSLAKPMSSLAAGIAAAKTAHKRVYACAETYAEAITFEDAVSVFGYFDCSKGWSVGTAHARVAPTTSPAAQASNITTPTRIEAVDIIAPDFTSSSQSSIGLIASASPALTIVHATIHAGTGGKGDDGANGIQLTDSGTAKNGKPSWKAGVCVLGSQSCPFLSIVTSRIGGAAGGTNACAGASGHDGGNGGVGGAAGEYQAYSNNWWSVNGNYTSGGGANPATPQTALGGGVGKDGTAGATGANGADGVTGGAVGTLSASGYTSSDGTAGTDGQPGQGGGGAGGYPIQSYDWNPTTYVNDYAWGESGAGGGAGGCPGLAGQPGKGGGASVAVIAIQSPFVLDTVIVETSGGGAGGVAGAPSAPTLGGTWGLGAYYTGTGGMGGKGGDAGVSGNGAGGPSLGLAYQGTEPTLLASTIKQGVGGAGVTQRVVNYQTIPASPNGLSKDIYNF